MFPETVIMKIFYSLLLAFFPAFLFSQAPVNDDCDGLIDLGVVPFCSDPEAYTNVDATLSDIDAVNNVPDCFNSDPEHDVWFQFMVPADGSLVDVVISVFGDVAGQGTLQNPQLAIYRGDCEFGGLAELDCATAPVGVHEVHLEQLGLTPGIPYYLRITDFSEDMTPNWGTFRLCIEPYVPDVIMGESPSSSFCSGTLWDSGGPDGDYMNNENLSFTICPQDFHECIIITVEEYEIESGFDFLQFYQGDNTNAPQITQLSGSGSGFEVQVPTDCATIGFTSDLSVTNPGFQITWECSPLPCTVPPITTCADPVVIPGLPYDEDGLSNCLSGNAISSGPCDDDFLAGNDYVFSYDSPGDECIQVQASTGGFGGGVGVYLGCPDEPGAECITAGAPNISAAFLEEPGTYYLVFGSAPQCTQFDIFVDTVTCPVVLPSASNCEDALDIGGCSTFVPEVIQLNPGGGDPNFIVDGVNQGCWVNPQQNYSFFYFIAGADGQFGFTVQSADPTEASDIDYNVWGPIDSVSFICDFVSNNQPVRSSWAGGADPTGLADIHPVNQLPVTDNYDCGSPATPGAAGDDFTSLLDVEEGKVYVVLLDDFGNAIVNGGISADFSATTPGVLELSDQMVTISSDTVLCQGETVQLLATGGEAYQWNPSAGLSCSNCPDPIANPDVSTEYEVQIASTCNVITRTVNVKVRKADLGPDLFVCSNSEFKLNPDADTIGDETYVWIGDGLSCYDCPSPVVSGLTVGVYEYLVTMTTPDCVIMDTLIINVQFAQAPSYEISDHLDICEGTTVELGGAAQTGTVYGWFSEPPGFTSDEPNPSVTPTESTIYYLLASNLDCPFSYLDSVIVDVFEEPILDLIPDTSICQGDQVLLSYNPDQQGMQYEWTPDDGSLDSTGISNPTATPDTSTTYTLVAFNEACMETREIHVEVEEIAIEALSADTFRICQGDSVDLSVLATPSSLSVEWFPALSLDVDPDGLNATASPVGTTLYTARVESGSCVREQSFYIMVDSLPDDLSIMPGDTMVCEGSEVFLISPIFEPAEHPGIEFEWTPFAGQITPDSLYNMVIQPVESAVYSRITILGECRDTSSMNVNVIPVADMSISPADTIVCPGESVDLSLTYTPGVTDIEWMPGDGLSCTDCDNPTATPEFTTVYSVNGDFNGCPVNASATIQVLPPPQFDFPDDVDLCAGDSVLLNGISIPFTDYQWTSSPPGFTSMEPQPVVSPTENTSYFVVADNGCESSGEITIMVANASLEVSSDTLICKGYEVDLMAVGSLPGSFSWSNGEMGNTIQVNPDESTAYTVTYTYGDGCELMDTILVGIQGQVADLTPPADLSICPGEFVLLNSSETPGAIYSWTSNPAGFTSNASMPQVAPTETTTYTVTTTFGFCTTTTEITIEAPNPTFALSADTTICVGEMVELEVDIEPLAGTLMWSDSSAGSSLTLTPQTTGDYWVDYIFGDSCVITDTVTVTVVPTFDLGIFHDPPDSVLALGVELYLEAMVDPPNTNGFEFIWLENGQTEISTEEMTTTVVSTNDTTIFYKLTAISPQGCVQMANVTFDLIQPEVELPNAFTPDGDGVNDLFRLIAAEGTAFIESMQIYNRWGNLVFESQEPDAAWDGKIDGNEAASDVYVYVVFWRRADGALQPALTGDLTLIR